MVGFQGTKTVLVLVLVVMATTLANVATAHKPGTCIAIDVKALGAKGDGRSQDCGAFDAAWKQACASPTGATIIVPKGDYLVNTLQLNGPCLGPITMDFHGNLKAPATAVPGKQHCGWLEFYNLKDFTLNGNGAIFDGQGSAAWKANDCAKTGKCNNLPINLRFTGLNHSVVKDITSTDSKLFHMNIINCHDFLLENIGVNAPPESLNTDGIHIGRSCGVTIRGAHISTGDDCVSIGDGTENFLVEGVTCGPGHGLSIGSLGKYPNEAPVRGITIRKSTIKNTSNGVRIKTWPGSPPGIASGIIFEDITMDNVSTPILIDQAYCPYGHCKKGDSLVKISDVTFKNIRGTASDRVVVKLICSKGFPCTNVALENIDLKSTSKEGPAASACLNVKPISRGKNCPQHCTEVAIPGQGH